MNPRPDIRAARRWGAQRVGGTDALLLLALSVGASKEKVLMQPEFGLDDGARERFVSLIERRSRGEPMAYLRGFAEFWRDRFAVGPGVLVPRPESELLVSLAARRAPGSLAEFGVGSGAVLLSIARELPAARLYGTDSSEVALGFARKNARALGHEGVALYCGDLAQPLWERNIKVAGLVMNPPYVAKDAPGLGPELSFEPKEALFAKEGGLFFYRRLVREAPRVLDAGGTLWVEIGAGMDAKVQEIFAAGLRFERLEVHPDLAGIPRVVEVGGIRP